MNDLEQAIVTIHYLDTGSPAHAGIDLGDIWPFDFRKGSPARAVGEAIGGVDPGHRPYGPSTRGRNSETSGM